MKLDLTPLEYAVARLRESLDIYNSDLALRQALHRSELAEWLEFRRNRGTIIHAYNEEKTQEVFGSVPDFLQEARCLLNRLHERNESLG